MLDMLTSKCNKICYILNLNAIKVNVKQLTLHYECTCACDVFSPQNYRYLNDVSHFFSLKRNVLMMWFVKKKSCVRCLNGFYDMIGSRYFKVCKRLWSKKNDSHAYSRQAYAWILNKEFVDRATKDICIQSKQFYYFLIKIFNVLQTHA